VNGVIRPKMTVLPESAQIPDRNLIQPPPNQFTHEVKAEQPYYYEGLRQAAAPQGTLPQGVKVVLLCRDGPECRVADGGGLYVATAFSGLRPIRKVGRKRRASEK
jgi:hypothetical protein